MSIIESVAEELHISPGKLEHESLRVYLEHRINAIDSELFSISKQIGISDIFTLDEKIREGDFHESEVYEEYFALDNLLADKEKLSIILNRI